MCLAQGPQHSDAGEAQARASRSRVKHFTTEPLRSLFSVHGHVKYQIKLKHRCSKMVAHILPSDPHPSPWVWGWGQKFKSHLFYKMVRTCIFELNRITNSATWYQIFSRWIPHHPRPWGSKGQNSTFSEHVHIAYQIKGTHVYSNKLANIFPTEPPLTVPGGHKVKINFSENGHVVRGRFFNTCHLGLKSKTVIGN